MKLAVVVLLLSVVSAASAQTPPATDARARGLRGAVRSVREEVADLRSDGASAVEGPRRLVRTEDYDAHGRLTAATTYSDGVATERQVFSRIDSSTIAIASEHRLSAAHFALVSSGGSPVRGDEPGSWQSERSLCRVKRDASGRDLDTVYLSGDAHSSPLARERVKYDGHGRAVESTRMTGDGSLLGGERYDYDADGLLVAVTATSATGGIVQVTTFEGYVFDRQGNWTCRLEHMSVAGVVTDRVVYRTITYQPPRSVVAARSRMLARNHPISAVCWMARAAACANVSGSHSAGANVTESVSEVRERGDAVRDGALAVGNREKTDDEPTLVFETRNVVTVEVTYDHEASTSERTRTETRTETETDTQRNDLVDAR